MSAWNVDGSDDGRDGGSDEGSDDFHGMPLNRGFLIHRRERWSVFYKMLHFSFISQRLNKQSKRLDTTDKGNRHLARSALLVPMMGTSYSHEGNITLATLLIANYSSKGSSPKYLSKSLWKRRSCMIRYFSNSVSACSTASSWLTVPALSSKGRSSLLK